ncbi:nucleotidyltransferase family protein [Marinicella sp. S1101]|uniref:nucleotidyltransferase family protein n=1 Tax=Marinicella marina TaxID=2996016 RepID=UPI002260D2EE|nr:nucleotidyltransferase family protein [Marinicella marina]MCX7552826.1 nucleotidyltransferase family protein [Marinicella marina]MDJ1139865.1 nucleotidyltransferase family protein [Marinicella marina]
MRINGLILAAGNSSRLGQPKQLVMYENQTLLQRIERTLWPMVDGLFVVLGSQHEYIAKALKQATPLLNENWQQGMASSLRLGMQQAKDQADAVLVALCDQPKIPQSHYHKLIQLAVKNPNHIIATSYNNQAGVPAVFQQTHFAALDEIRGKKGAQSMLRQGRFPLKTAACAAAAFDVDLPVHMHALKTD